MVYNVVVFKELAHKKELNIVNVGSFTRGEAVILGAKFSMSARSVDEMLKNAIPSLLLKLKSGHYEKV